MQRFEQKYISSIVSIRPWQLTALLWFQYSADNIKTLCQQFGTLQGFLPNLQFGQAFACYKSKEDVMNAEKKLAQLSLHAEMVGEAEVQKMTEMLAAATSSSSSSSSVWSKGGASNWNGGASSGGLWGGSSSGSSLWGNPDDHNSLLPGNLLSQ